MPRRAPRPVALISGVIAWCAVACAQRRHESGGQPSDARPARLGAEETASAQPSGPADAASAPTVDAGVDAAEVNLPGRTDGCPEGMVRVEGEYCPAVFQNCIEHHPEWEKRQGQPGVAERCLRYAEPTKCLVKKRRHMDFCMDRYEYPNVPGELPQVLTSWLQAREICKKQNKRLCSDHEFHFACEGPEMLPYVYGYVRDPKTCNQDREYRLPDHNKALKHYARCLKDEWCAGELARLDQRERIGERKTCVSWAGVFDLNGNVNEWVALPERPPKRSGLKGGWWGPIRSRCRAVTTFHPEDDYGYEVGFRCCADVDGGATAKR